MVKKIIFLCALMAIGTTKPFSFDTLVKSLFPARFNQLLENQKEMLVKLEPHIPNIISQKTVTHDYYNHTTTYGINYHYETPEARASHFNYLNAEQTLNNQLMITTLGDGFILGALVACLNKAVKGDRFDKKAIVATIVAAIGMVLYQNKKLGKVPCFDAELTKWDNQFENVSFYSVGRILTALAGAGASYLGTDYALSRAAQVYNDIKSSN